MPLEHPIKLPEPDKFQFNNWLYSVWAWITRRVASAGTYGDSTHVSQITVDADGQITGVASVAISFPAPTAVSEWNSLTWQDVTGSRAGATDYQNTTGGPIQVIVSGSGAAQNRVDCYVGVNTGAYVKVGGFNGSNAASDTGAVSFIVPNGHYYKAVVGASMSIHHWAELR